MDWPDGSYYIGEWKDNIKHGPGILVNTDGRIIEGSWVQDNLHGTSKVISPDGRVENVVWRSGLIDMEDKIDNLPVDDN
jgi:hypothetical protein